MPVTDEPTWLPHAVDPAANGTVGGEMGAPRPPLEFHTLDELRARVKAAGPRRWLIRGIWPAGTYGVHAAEQKAQKTWNAYDLAVSVATGTPWLGIHPVDDPGPVLLCSGEGGEASILRRLDALCEEHAVAQDGLPITVCARAPHLTDDDHMQLFADHITAVTPRLVILDPLYLSARGAAPTDLYAMGGMLERPQHLCSDVGAALLVVHHYNRQRDVRSPGGRISGAGPAEWGRVLIGGQVISRHTDPGTRRTHVLTELDAIGGDIPDGKWRVHRQVWADDPDDLDSPLHVTTTVTEITEAGADDTEDLSDMPPARRKLLDAVRATATVHEPQPSTALVDWIVQTYGHGMRRETVSRELGKLADAGLIDSIDDPASSTHFPRKLWWSTQENS